MAFVCREEDTQSNSECMDKDWTKRALNQLTVHSKLMEMQHSSKRSKTIVVKEANADDIHHYAKQVG